MRKLILPLLLLLCSTLCAAAAKDSRVVVVIAGSSSIRDFADPTLPGFPELFSKGSAALLNVRAGRWSRDSEPGAKSGFESGCVSLGAGAMATAGAEASRAGSACGEIGGTRVSDLFRARTDINPAPDQVLHLEIAKLNRINAAASYRARPGALGSALREAGIHTAVVGDSDIAGGIHREVVTVAMDSSGVVDYGQVEGLFSSPDGKSPYGSRTDTAALLDGIDSALKHSRFVVVDFGDTFRADEYAESCTDEQAVAVRHAADARLGAFVQSLAARLNLAQDFLIVLSPNARGFSEIEGEKMGAILIVGPGFGGGMLTSPSTRRPGVVTLSDVAPTVLAFFGLEPTRDMVGRPMNQTGSGSAAEDLLKMNERACIQVQRQPTMRGASVAQSVIVCLVTAAVLFVTLASVRKLAAWLATAVAALPLAMLYLPPIYSGGLVGTVAVLVLLTLALIGLCSAVFRSPARAFVWMCVALVISLMVDLLRGAPLMAESIAGYNISEGARYYGIGNELLGTLLGSAIVGLGMALAGAKLSTRMAGLVMAAVFGSVFVFIAAPELGAKVGGAIALAPAMVAVILARRGWKPSFRSIAVVVLVTMLLVGAMFAVDALRSGSDQSHAGRTADLIVSGNASGVFGIFARKLSLNFMLVATSLWSRLLGLCLAASVVLVWWGRREHSGAAPAAHRAGLQERPVGRGTAPASGSGPVGPRTGKGFLDREESAAAIGCCVATAAAFFFNDSGVLAGATCSVFLWALLALKLLDRATKCPGD